MHRISIRPIGLVKFGRFGLPGVIPSERRETEGEILDLPYNFGRSGNRVQNGNY